MVSIETVCGYGDDKKINYPSCFKGLEKEKKQIKQILGLLDDAIILLSMVEALSLDRAAFQDGTINKETYAEKLERVKREVIPQLSDETRRYYNDLPTEKGRYSRAGRTIERLLDGLTKEYTKLDPASRNSSFDGLYRAYAYNNLQGLKSKDFKELQKSLKERIEFLAGYVQEKIKQRENEELKKELKEAGEFKALFKEYEKARDAEIRRKFDYAAGLLGEDDGTTCESKGAKKTLKYYDLLLAPFFKKLPILKSLVNLPSSDWKPPAGSNLDDDQIRLFSDAFLNMAKAHKCLANYEEALKYKGIAQQLLGSDEYNAKFGNKVAMVQMIEGDIKEKFFDSDTDASRLYNKALDSIHLAVFGSDYDEPEIREIHKNFIKRILTLHHNYGNYQQFWEKADSYAFHTREATDLDEEFNKPVTLASNDEGFGRWLFGTGRIGVGEASHFGNSVPYKWRLSAEDALVGKRWKEGKYHNFQLTLPVRSFSYGQISVSDILLKSGVNPMNVGNYVVSYRPFYFMYERRGDVTFRLALDPAKVVWNEYQYNYSKERKDSARVVWGPIESGAGINLWKFWLGADGKFSFLIPLRDKENLPAVKACPDAIKSKKEELEDLAAKPLFYGSARVEVVFNQDYLALGKGVSLSDIKLGMGYKYEYDQLWPTFDGLFLPAYTKDNYWTTSGGKKAEIDFNKHAVTARAEGVLNFPVLWRMRIPLSFYGEFGETHAAVKAQAGLRFGSFMIIEPFFEYSAFDQKVELLGDEINNSDYQLNGGVKILW